MNITYNLPTDELSSGDSEVLRGFLEQLRGISSKDKVSFPNYRKIQLDESDNSFIVIDSLKGHTPDSSRLESVRKYSITSEGRLVEKGLIENSKPSNIF